MRFTSLVIELIRARPRLVVLIAVLLQAALWLVVSLAFYHSPPSDLAIALAYGREYQVGTGLGPPLAFWLGDIAYRIAGDHIFGVYLLAELCSIITFWALFLLGRALVGGQQAVLAVLLVMTVTAFGSSTLDFGPDVLARPLWALLLLHSWQLIGQGRRNAWFAFSIEAGLLLLTTSAGIELLLLVAAFAVATGQGRRTLSSLDSPFALLVIVALALPYLIWLIRAGTFHLPHWPPPADLHVWAVHWARLVGGLLLAMAGVLILIVANSARLNRTPEDAPIIYRPPGGPLARKFVYVFAIVPALIGSLISGLFNLDRVVAGAGVVLLMAGLAVIVATGDRVHLRRQRVLRAIWAALIVIPALGVIAGALFLPWAGHSEVATSLPARDIAQFFGDNFQRRTNRQLPAVAGDTQIASLVALGAGRPHLFIDAAPDRTPWMTFAKFQQVGGVVVWRASDTAGKPPLAISKRFPNLVPEVPQTFDWLVNGRQPVLRIGWAIVRPKEK